MRIDAGSDMFDVFVQWLYSGHFFKFPDGGILVLLKLWFFAAKISCLKLQNCTMDLVQDYHRQMWMKDEEMNYLFETAKYDEDEHALKKYCAAKLHYRNSQGGYLYFRDFLTECPSAIGPYIYYEQQCDDIHKLKHKDPTD